MKKLLFIVVSLIAITSLSSCAARKKLTKAQEEIATLQSQNAQLSETVSAMNSQVSDLTAKNTGLSNELSSCKANNERYVRSLAEIEAAFKELSDTRQELIKKLEDAGKEFQNKGVEVYSKDGIIYVNMQDNLLYKSGSATVSAEGKKAVGNLASVLNEYPELKVIVVGNTDSVRVKGVADNWSLSTERANGVVRLLGSNNVNPARLTAAGRGKFYPVTDNSTAEGRAKNRRTEIILNPDWGKLYQTVIKEKN